MLKLSKKGGYALKAILYIAENEIKLCPEGSTLNVNQEGDNIKILKISELSKSLVISESLLRRIISDLEKSGIVTTLKGRTGGVKLGKEINNISIFDILNSVGEELGITDCTKGLFCENIDNCSTTNLFTNLQKSFNGILKLQTLDKIVK